MEPRWKFEDDLSDFKGQGRSILEGQTAHAWQRRLSPEDCSVINRFSLRQLPRRLKILQQRCRTEACMEKFWFQSSWNVMKRRRRWICTYGEVLNYIGVTHGTNVLKGGCYKLQYIE